MADYNSSYTGAQIDEGIAAARAARTANGLLKSDGSGGVSAAVAGTDYATPAQIPTVPSAYTSNPEALGTARPGSATSWARGDHVHPKPSASDIGAVVANQGSGNAGKFLVVGSDGTVTPTAMSVWQGGNY